MLSFVNVLRSSVNLTFFHSNLLYSVKPAIQHNRLQNYKIFSHRNVTMGSTWSSTDREALKSSVNLPVIEWTRWNVKPKGMLFDSISLSISFEDNSLRELQKRFSEGAWKIVFEVDVAHLQKRLTLLTINTSLENKIQNINIPGEVIREKINQGGFGVSDLSNVCSLHSELILKDIEEPFAVSTVILDVGGERFQHCHSIEQLKRSAYGVLVDEMT